jgi:hypothetical protein
MPSTTKPQKVKLTLEFDGDVYAGLEALLDRAEYQDHYIDPETPEQGVKQRRRFATAEALIAELVRQQLRQLAQIIPAVQALQSTIDATQQQIDGLLKPDVAKQ